MNYGYSTDDNYRRADYQNPRNSTDFVS